MPIKTERLTVQWETGIAASGFWTADGQILEQGEVPAVMSKFQGKQPYSKESLEAIAYYEVKGYVVLLQYEDDSEARTHRILHIVSVERMEAAHHDLPPFIKPHS